VWREEDRVVAWMVRARALVYLENNTLAVSSAQRNHRLHAVDDDSVLSGEVDAMDFYTRIVSTMHACTI
jgi:hypothetical protein